MNRSNTLDSEVLQVAGQADNPRRRQLVVKLATNATAGGANISTTNVNSNKIIQQLENFVKTTVSSILANLSVALWNQQTYLEVLGEDLGTRILKVPKQQQSNAKQLETIARMSVHGPLIREMKLTSVESSLCPTTTLHHLYRAWGPPWSHPLGLTNRGNDPAQQHKQCQPLPC